MLTYREYPPPAGLRALLECLWLVGDSRARQNRPSEHVIPDACPELIFHLADPFARLVDGRWRRQPAAFLAGTLSRPWKLRPGARVRTLGVRFQPAAARSAFGLDMSTATDREIPLEALVPAAHVGELLATLREGGSDARSIASLRAWLLAQVNGRPGPDDLAARAVRAVLASSGRLRVAELAQRLGASRRRLERTFARHLGIRPKLFARIVRLQAALAALGVADRGSAADWALDAGYFDQAHLARDFRAIAGRRASQPRERDGPLARHFSDPERLMALLDGE